MTNLYECDIDGCDWTNPDWRYGFADAGATWAYHIADHKQGRINTHRPCDVCGQEATLTTGVTGMDLCDNPDCYGTAWDQAFEVSP